MRLKDLIRASTLLAAAALALASCGTGAGPISYGPSPSPSPSPGAGTVTVRVTDQFGSSMQASAFAWQDGGGPWQAGQAGQSTYTFQISGARYGFAVRCPGPDGTVHVYQLTIQDGTSWTVECAAETSTFTASYQVNYDASAVSAVSVGLWDAIYPPGSSMGPTGTIQMQNRRPGLQDLVLAASVNDGGSSRRDAIKVVRDVNVPQNSPYSITVSTQDRVGRGQGTLQWSGNVTGVNVDAYYVSPRGTWLQVSAGFGQGNTLLFDTLANLAGGRYLAGVASCCSHGGEAGGQLYFRLDTATTYNFTLPPFWHGLGFSSNPRPGFTGLNYTGFPNLPTKAYVLQVQLQDNTFWIATLSLNWLGSQTSYTFPDLSGISGFPGLSQPVSRWFAQALAVQFAPGQGQNLRWASSLARTQALRRGVGTQQVRSMQGPVPVPGALEGGGAFRLGDAD